MSSSQDSPPDEPQLVRYLLGLLPEEEAERLDEMSIVDDAVASRLVAVENDLIDAYVRGSLAGATLEQFKAHYLKSPHRLRKVAFAESLLMTVDAADRGRGSASSSVTRMVPRSMLAWSLAVAATLLLVASGWLVLREARVRDGLREAQRQGSALDRRARELEQQLENERHASAATAKELESARAALAERASQAPSPAATSRMPTTVALVLSPQTRSTGPVPTVAISVATDAVPFELLLEANDFSRYEVGLQDPATDQTLWRSGRVAARSAGGQRLLSISVPAGALKSQHYALVLSGFDAAGTGRMFGSYTFRVVRR